MQHYHNLLYVSHGASDQTDGLKQALSLARNNKAPLTVLVLIPAFPKEFADYKEKYETLLLEDAKAMVSRTQQAIEMQEDAIDIRYALSVDETPVVRIIQYVLQHGHDMVIKEAASVESRKGFQAVDMDLLRKCPVALWLCRPIEQSRADINVAVAIDPESVEPAAEALSQRMLELSRSLADSCSGALDVISCWDYEFESYLRGNVWVQVSDGAIAETVLHTQQVHRAKLEGLIKNHASQGEHTLHHLRGKATELIPGFVEDKQIDILVMGTVARTGIPGFIIGNTAENIVQKLSCSLLALKPQGFVSPIKAYD